MKKVASLLMAALFLGSMVFAGTPVVVDQTGTDFQSYWYTGTYGKQITVDDDGKVHIAYCKTFVTESDTGYQVTYANVTDNKILPIPSQEPDDPIQPGVVFIGGGKNGTPVYMYYGVGSRMYGYGPEMHLQAMAKVSEDGNSIEPLGLQQDQNYYHNPHYSNPIAMEVDEVNGICHIIQSNPGGSDVAYWNFDGTNFGEIYNLIWTYPDQDVPGHRIPGRFRRNATKGADLAVSADGQEVTVATLHPFQQIFLHKGAFGGEIWADDFDFGMEDGSIVALFNMDTTLNDLGTNIPNNDPKPYLSVQVKYDDDGGLHVLYDATYMDVYVDTSGWYGYFDGWMNNYGPTAGDTLAVFYDGTEHPKPQIRYWNSTMPTQANTSYAHTLVAECTYPLPGDKFEWYDFGVPDSGLGTWGKFYSSGPIENMDFVVNSNPQDGEPKMLVVWEEMQGEVQALTDTNRAFCYTYYAFHKDLKIAVSQDGMAWSAPFNITQTNDLDETDVSVYKDVVDNKIHMMYYQDNFPGQDRVMTYVDSYQEKYFLYTGHQGFSVPIRVNTEDQVKVMYQEFDLTGIMTGVDDRNAAPTDFALAQNYPNPFNPSTEIRFTAPAGQTRLEVYNVLGQRIKTLVDKNITAGTHSVVWDGTDFNGNLVTSGLYFYKLQSAAGVKVKKMMFQK